MPCMAKPLPPRVKLADVAERAGVSVATVSKVVNDRYGVAEETAARVKEAIEELGYAGNIGASGLRMQATNVLGVLVSSFEPFSAELLKGAARVAEGEGFEIIAHSGGDSFGWERRSLARLGGTIIAGALIVTATVLDADPAVPVVAVDPHYGPNRLPTVDSDGFSGTVGATRYLIDRGHTRIAFLGGRAELDSSHLREAGYREAIQEAGLPLDTTLIRQTRYDPALAREATRELLMLEEPPTALLCGNDQTAIAAADLAGELGLEVPRDLSIIGFDDIPDAALHVPPLTTVRQPLQAMGAEAMSMLIAMVRDQGEGTHVRMPTELVERDSVGPPRPGPLRLG